MLQPPTDNLYKFLAIFGLVLFGMGAWLPLQRYELAAQQAVRSEEVWDPLYSQIGQRHKEAGERLECAAAPTSVPPRPECLSIPPAPSATSAAEIEFQAVLARAKQQTRQTDFLVGQYYLYLWLGVAMMVSGFALSVVGFRLWYARLQRYQDASVQREGSPHLPASQAPKKRRR